MAEARRLGVRVLPVDVNRSSNEYLVEKTPDGLAVRLAIHEIAGISEAERKMRFGRQLYNEAVKVYNAALQQWPTRLLRRLFDLQEAAAI